MFLFVKLMNNHLDTVLHDIAYWCLSGTGSKMDEKRWQGFTSDIRVSAVTFCWSQTLLHYGAPRVEILHWIWKLFFCCCGDPISSHPTSLAHVFKITFFFFLKCINLRINDNKNERLVHQILFSEYSTRGPLWEAATETMWSGYK